MILCLLDAFDDALIQPFVPDRAVVALDAGILLGLPRLDMLDRNALFLGPFSQLFTDIFRANADPYGAWFVPIR